MAFGVVHGKSCPVAAQPPSKIKLAFYPDTHTHTHTHTHTPHTNVYTHTETCAHIHKLYTHTHTPHTTYTHSGTSFIFSEVRESDLSTIWLQSKKHEKQSALEPDTVTS